MPKVIKWTKEMIKELNILGRNEFEQKYGVSQPTQARKAKELGIPFTKGIVWTEEMINDLKTLGKEAFTKKYDISYTTQRKKLNELKERKSEQPQPCEIREVVVNKLDKVFSNYKEYSANEKFYIQGLRNKHSQVDKTISDLEHHLENYIEDLADKDIAEVGRKIAEARRERRMVKDEIDFIDKYKTQIEEFKKFEAILDGYIEYKDNRSYKTRVLKQELGTRQYTKSLKDKRIVARLLELEKANIKYERSLERQAQGKSYIDRIKNTYMEDFNKLDTLTREDILKECYAEYGCQGVDIDEVKDYVVWNKILPKKLVNKGYFVK